MFNLLCKIVFLLLIIDCYCTSATEDVSLLRLLANMKSINETEFERMIKRDETDITFTITSNNETALKHKVVVIYFIYLQLQKLNKP